MKWAVKVKRSLKFLLYLVLFLLLSLVLLVVYVLNTESGSRAALNYGIKLANIDLTYDHVNGKLSTGLILDNIKYSSEDIDIDIGKFIYKSQWFWFDRHIEFSQFDLNNVSLTTKTSRKQKQPSQPFTGLEIPISIDLKNLQLKDLTIHSNGESHHIKSIDLVAEIKPKTISINHLKMTSADHGISVGGQIEYGYDLNYSFETDWLVRPEGYAFDGQGTVSGNLNEVNFNHQVDVESDLIQGQYEFNGKLKSILRSPEFYGQITGGKSNLLFDEQSLELENTLVELNGSLHNYNLSLHTDLSHKTMDQVSIPSSQIILMAEGNMNQLITQKAQLITKEGSVELDAQMNWEKQLNIKSKIKVADFNPGQLIESWPGQLTGIINLNLEGAEQGVVVKTQNNEIKGQLRGQLFKITGGLDYAIDTFSSDNLNVALGENSVFINGQINKDDVALKAVIKWPELSVLSEQLAGAIEGVIEFKGGYLNPQFKVDLSGQSLKLGKHQMSSLQLASEGVWGSHISSQSTVKNAVFNEQGVDLIKIKQSGWLDEHTIELVLKDKSVNSILRVEGAYDDRNNKQPTWQGILLEHELIIEKNNAIKLLQPVEILIGQTASIGASCWQGTHAGRLCLKFDEVNFEQNRYHALLTADAFSTEPLHGLFPEEFLVNGQLSGTAEFNFSAGDFEVESELKLYSGELHINNGHNEPHQVAISDFTVQTKSANQSIDINTHVRLADDSFLKLQAKLENQNEDWAIVAKLDGALLTTNIIQDLFEEVEELNGQLLIDGSIKGELLHPDINVRFNQSDGYLTLARLGTVMEGIELNINTQLGSQSVYQIEFSGNNLAAINQGRIESHGKLSLNVNNQWQYIGKVSGENFMVMNLPEVRFNVSPELAIVANKNAAEIKGDLLIDSGQVKVKQLADSGISNSGDLKIHTIEKVETNPYPLNIDINTQIKTPIELDVIGLMAELTGSIQLAQSKEQALTGKGILNLSDGSYEIYGQKLDINEGELLFTGPLDNPRLKVKASRKSVSGDVLAGVELGGTVNNLQSSLYSEPSLSDIEKLSYIMTGRGVDDSGRINGESLKQAAIVMGLNQSSPVFNQIQNQFGIDVLTVRESAATEDTVVEAGKKINDRLYVSYNQGLFNRLGFWLLKYRINEFLNLETTQGEDQSIELVYIRKSKE